MNGRCAALLIAILAACLLPVRADARSAGDSNRVGAVVAVVAEHGIDVLHPEFATADGADLVLPPAVKSRVVVVKLPRGGSQDQRRDALMRSALRHPRTGQAYYISGTRLVVVATEPGLDLTTDDFHGTAVTSVAGGRRVGTGQDVLMVTAVGTQDPAWAWTARQSWIDVATTSTFPILGATEPPYMCSSAGSVARMRRSGQLLFAAAGNGPEDTYLLPPGGLPGVIRVGGVHPDGTSVNPYVDGTEHSPYMYSAREYDVAELFTMTVADNSAPTGYSEATGTSGSSPRVAGRVAQLLAELRRAVGDSQVGVRNGALVRAQGRRPVRGPLADGKLTADELQILLFHRARPSLPEQPGRYTQEGFGYFDAKALTSALSEGLGRSEAMQRVEDDQEHQIALRLREAQALARACKTE
jgi:subtilisin family serine protease